MFRSKVVGEKMYGGIEQIVISENNTNRTALTTATDSNAREIFKKVAVLLGPFAEFRRFTETLLPIIRFCEYR